MKEFNKDRELNKLKLKNNKNKYIKYGSIIISVLILVVGIIYFTFAKFESRESYTLIEGKVVYAPKDVIISYYYDEENKTVPPEKNSGYIIKNVNCENADGIWSNKSWTLNLSNITGQVKCMLEFEQGEDTSVTQITYGTIIDLGEGTSFDIKTLAPDVDYTKLTNDNFYISTISSMSGSGSADTRYNGSDGSWIAGGYSISSSVSFTKSYNSSTGVASIYASLSSSGSGSCSYSGNKTTSFSRTASVHAYLVLN